MYLFGGSNLETENKHLWMLDLKSFEWRIVKPVVRSLVQPNNLACRDLFFLHLETSILWTSTATPWSCLVETCVETKRTVSISMPRLAPSERLFTHSFILYDLRCRLSFSDLRWEKMRYVGKDAPCPRAGHSSVLYRDNLYVFGGKDNDNIKLNDLWK